MLFHGTADGVVPYQWAVNTYNQAIAAGLDSFLTSWAGAGHVPYVQHRTEILEELGRGGFGWDAIFVPEGDTYTSKTRRS